MASVTHISKDELRRMFNDGGYYQKTRNGQLISSIRNESHSIPISSGQPYCTWSQILEYRNLSGTKVAIVHQYLKPNGTIGATRLPDPKWLLKDGVIYAPLK